MDDRGELCWFLGMKISNFKNCVTLDQEESTKNILARFNMSDCKPSKTPAEVNLKLENATEESELAEATLYRALVGSLLFLAKQTRPDIMWIVNVLSRFMDKPAVEHWQAEKRVLRYLQYSKNQKLLFPKRDNLILFGETDAD